MKRLNCWESKKCGREPGGQHQELGVCPAAVEKRLDGVHAGANAGRACWVVAGTFCNGDVQGSFAKKYANCEKCDFYSVVQNEEAHNFKLALYLIGKLKDPVPTR